MTAHPPTQNSDTRPALSDWQMVRLSDYDVPTKLSDQTLKKGWTSVGRLFRDSSSQTDLAYKEAELRELSLVRLAHLVPPIDWSPASAALTKALRDTDSQANPAVGSTAGETPSEGNLGCVRVLVGQPFCNHQAILAEWADQHHARVLAPPSAAQILAGDASWLETLDASPGQPWVLPALERCFLRHSQGLDLLRNFLDRAMSGAFGPGIIGCDSWAFAFVQRIWPLPGTHVLTLQAFDGPMLTGYFVRRPRATNYHKGISFYSVRSGKPLVPPVVPTGRDQAPNDNDERERVVPELSQLAAHCHGNPGLAWHYWRKQLRSPSDNEQDDRAARPDARNPAAQLQTDSIVWVASGVQTPSLPGDTGDDVAFLLHALLLHRCLPADLLMHVVPMPRTRVMSQLLQLQAQGLLVREQNAWQIAPLAYRTVREFLRSHGYLTDAF